MLEIFSVGGYEEVGKNSTAVRYDDELVIFDLGLHMEKLVNLEENENLDLQSMHAQELISIGAIPNINVLNSIKKQAVGIVCNHCHLDHVGAVPKLADAFDCPVIATPFTIELIDSMIKEEKSHRPKNALLPMKAGEKIALSDNLELEFVHMTHSTPNTVFSVLHTPEGAVVYANDYKFDNFPTLEPKPDYGRLRKISEEGVKALIVETVRVERARKTPSESVAKLMLEDVLLGRKHDRGLAVTTFASHIARIKSILEIARKLDRQVYIMGRSMAKYLSIAQKLHLIDLPRDVKVFGRGKTVAEALGRVSGHKEEYLILCTGHQGEPGSVLDRIADNKMDFKFTPGDEIIFSSETIPSPINIQNKYKLDNRLKLHGTRLFNDVHVSGHASKEDHRDLIALLQPEHIVPCHGNLTKLAEYAELATEMNIITGEERYTLGKTVHLMHNGQNLKL